MAANVLQVAKYILQQTGPLTTMKLQKLAYYCQAWSLVWDDVPLFEEDFEAWANGPVCRRLFNHHQGYYIIDESNMGSIKDYTFSDCETETIHNVLEFYKDKTPLWLSELTHQEEPWKQARQDCAPGQPCQNIITKDSMLDYYSSL